MARPKLGSGMWIGPPLEQVDETGVWEFSRELALDKMPKSLSALVSADQRYKLYVNDAFVGLGPGRGDPAHWFFEEYDLAPFLREGLNQIRAVVWNFGRLAPMAQCTSRTGFLMVGEGLTTPDGWQLRGIPAHQFAPMWKGDNPYYVDVGPGEFLDASRLEEPFEFIAPNVICRAELRGTLSGGTPWCMVPNPLPPMRHERVSEPKLVVRRGYAEDKGSEYSDQYTTSVVLLRPGESVLWDARRLTCAYPRFTCSGRGTLTITFAEGLWQDDGEKGHRDDVAGKRMKGMQDQVRLFGTEVAFEPLWWRTFRYVLLEYEGIEPAEIRVEWCETGYPYQVESSFEAEDPRAQPLWDVSIHTAKSCAGETYFDCPYYEQLQYVGDTRIQALLHYYLSRDRRLQRNAIQQFYWSLLDNGLTQSRYPSRQLQVIPPFSLWWILMLWDQTFYDDPFARPSGVHCDTLRRVLEGVREAARREPDMQFWPFCDWVPEWRMGVPPDGLNGAEHQLILILAERAIDDLASVWEAASTESNKAFEEFDSTGSEHARALYRLLYGPDVKLKPLAPNAAKCTYYFSYYKFLAEPPEDILAAYAPWTAMIENGLTTFAENPEPVRSDCHAWSAHPALGFLQTVAGVTSTAPGWIRARIEPRPCGLSRFNAKVAHPRGDLWVRFDEGRLQIDTPVQAEIVWNSESHFVEPGQHRLD